MSSEPDYNFNQPAAANSDGLSLQLPFALLSAAIAVLMISQTVTIWKARTSLRETKTQAAEAFRNREALVKQSKDIQDKLQALMVDLLILSKTDEDAKAIVAKYNIQQNGAAGAAPAPADAAKP